VGGISKWSENGLIVMMSYFRRLGLQYRHVISQQSHMLDNTYNDN